MNNPKKADTRTPTATPVVGASKLKGLPPSEASSNVFDQQTLLAEAKVYLQLHYHERETSAELPSRLDDVQAQVAHTGSYQHTFERTLLRCEGRVAEQSPVRRKVLLA